MSDWKQVYSGILSSHAGKYKEARGNSELRNEILAEVKVKILQHELLESVDLPHNLRVAIRMEYLPQLDPQDQEEEIAVMQHILAATGKRQEILVRIFKEEVDSYDRERRDTKDQKTIGQRTRIVQQWWESLSDDRKAEAGRAAEKYRRKNLPTMARDLIQTLHRTMGAHVLMFVSHEVGEGQVKMAVPWKIEKQEVEISLDVDGNPELPARGGQKLKVQQNLARAVFQAAYAKFTKKPKAKVPWGLLIKSPTEYLDSESIPEGFTMKDPSKWTKADLGLLWDHWQSLEAEEKVIVSFTDCKKEDAPLSRQFDRKVVGSSKKRVWVTVEDDSEADFNPLVNQWHLT
ncbi:hypothetical protein F5141DRAFT_1060132 [Pisolithus sp. B1]|nr:hypothetical protein F5141DRAFT_1060132 [Pisolithus sp. B1]